VSQLPTLPKQPAGIPWPTAEWPRAALPAGADEGAIDAFVERTFSEPAPEDLGSTHAILVVQRGEIVLERYDADHTATSTLPSWSMAKSMLHAILGILVRDGRLDLHAAADVPAWQGADDPRRAITVEQLLRMKSGLEFVEVYDDSGHSDTLEMLFRSGREDVAGYAESRPLESVPDTWWSYSSGTSNILSAISKRVLERGGNDYLAFMRRELFDPIGMRTVSPRFDATGTWIASSFAFATARDFARFGLLYLRDGCWDGRRILPSGWVDHARTPTRHCAGQYGAHFWLAQDGSGAFSANGFLSQYIVMVPSRDLVLVRLGNTPVEKKRALLLSLAELIRAFPEAG
jgi:CubicO group peptidase (beta-lactamase class C family)